MEVTKSKGAYSSAEQAFDTLLLESVTEVFNGVLGKIAGQALVDAIKTDSSLEIHDLLKSPDLLDETLRKYLGLAADILERKILRTLATKTATGGIQVKNAPVNFTAQVAGFKSQFLKRKEAGNLPQTLE